MGGEGGVIFTNTDLHLGRSDECLERLLVAVEEGKFAASVVKARGGVGRIFVDGNRGALVAARKQHLAAQLAVKAHFTCADRQRSGTDGRSGRRLVVSGRGNDVDVEESGSEISPMTH